MARETRSRIVAVTQIIVNVPWAICIAREDAASLMGLRLVPGLEIGLIEDTIWLRGPRGDEQLQAKLSALPARARFELLDSNQLRQIGQRVPGDRLPTLQWQQLSSWLRLEMPTAAFPAESPSSVPLRLVRSTDEHDPELLLTELNVLAEFVAMAARVRLDPLQFAANSKGQILVRGRPLPPVPGQRFVLHSGVAVPAGYWWEPKVSPDVLARRFNVSGGALVVWNENNVMTRLHSEQFVPLSRSALRATQQALSLEQ